MNQSNQESTSAVRRLGGSQRNIKRQGRRGMNVEGLECGIRGPLMPSKPARFPYDMERQSSEGALPGRKEYLQEPLIRRGGNVAWISLWACVPNRYGVSDRET